MAKYGSPGKIWFDLYSIGLLDIIRITNYDSLFEITHARSMECDVLSGMYITMMSWKWFLSELIRMVITPFVIELFASINDKLNHFTVANARF